QPTSSQPGHRCSGRARRDMRAASPSAADTPPWQIATCSSQSSRNTTVGVRLGRGEALADIIGSTSMVAEGVRSSASVLALARRHGVDMPITEQVVAICHGGVSAADGLAALMSRRARPEHR
ncbi:MAG: NAD(P)H-dependent glycerol-3-phosphate dehydrogenase, partial [Actinomycetota bacterium]